MPAVPLVKTDARREFLNAVGACFLLSRKTHLAATRLGAYMFRVVVISAPVKIIELCDPNPAVRTEGLNYFADTLLFGGAIFPPRCGTGIPAGVGFAKPPLVVSVSANRANARLSTGPRTSETKPTRVRQIPRAIRCQLPSRRPYARKLAEHFDR